MYNSQNLLYSWEIMDNYFYKEQTSGRILKPPSNPKPPPFFEQAY